jgi:hypothetical protein
VNWNQETTNAVVKLESTSLKIVAREGDFIEGLGPLTFVGQPRFNQEQELVTFVSNMSAVAPSAAGIFVADTAPVRLLFPQIADGKDSRGNWRTTIMLANRTSSSLSATLSFYDDSGAPIQMSVAGQEQSQIQLEIPALGITRLQTDGTGTLKAGWAAVQANERLSGIALFGYFDIADNLINEVAANATVPLRSMSLFAQTGSDSATGVAIANPNASTAADVTLILTDKNATEVARTSVTIPGRGHVAKYSSELFPQLRSGSFEGKIEVVSSQPVVALTLRQVGALFTSLPVIP